jgi:hypothetical protein
MCLSLIVFAGKLEHAKNEAAGIRRGSVDKVHWWFLIPIAAAAGLLLYGLFRWAAAAPEIDDEIAKERFRAEQDWRSLRRSGIDLPPTHGTKEIKTPG